MAIARSTQFSARGSFVQGSGLSRGGLASPHGEPAWSAPSSLMASAISRAADLLPMVGPAVVGLLLFT
jgi:hypothetical protein